MTACSFTVVIPVGQYHHRLERCLQACSRLTYEPRTICVVSDEPLALPDDPHIINLVTEAGRLTSPGRKRDLAYVRYPQADVYAYLDDDAYPPTDWLEQAALVLVEHPDAAGVGGPGLMPDDQTFWERVSATVLEMRAGSGPLRFRFAREPARNCDDFPAYNLLLRKDRLLAVGGWATDWYGGEDTTLCARLADRGGFIRYDPMVYVYHYRRAIWPAHAWQIYNVGLSRGCFIRSGDSRSRRLTFFGPLGFLLVLLALAASPLLGLPVWLALLAGIGLFAGLAATSVRDAPALDWRARLISPIGLVIHHSAYAFGLLLGLATGRRTVRAREGEERSASGADRHAQRS